MDRARAAAKVTGANAAASGSSVPPPSAPSTFPTSSLTPYTELVDGIISRLSTVSHESSTDYCEHTQSSDSTDERQPILVSQSIGSKRRRKTLDNSSSMGSTKHPTSDQPSETCSSHHSFFIYLVTILSAIGGFLFGYDTGIVSGAMVYIRDYFHLSDIWQEVIVSATILAAWLFSLIAGYLTNAFGRKWVVILASFIFTVGGFMMALAEDKFVLLGGRFTVGAAIGLASMVIPVYIAEVAPVQIRGKLVTINTCFITFGQFVASLLAGVFSSDQVHGWRWMLGIASVPSIIQMVFFIFLPESPRWLIQKGRYDVAYESLTKFRGNTSPEEINAEFESIKDNCIASQHEQDSQSVGKIIRSPAILRALFVGCMLMMFQQLAGINTVMYYSATIIQMSGVHDKRLAVWLSALTASINFVFSFVGIVLVERLGRRMLTLSSLFGVVVALLVLGAGFNLAEDNSPKVTFHTSNQSVCSALNTCGDCIDTKVCGFCYYTESASKLTDTEDSYFYGSLIKSGINGTCLAYDPHNPLYSNSSIFCSNGTASDMIWATNWCPSNYSLMTLAGLMLYLFFFAPGMGPMPWTINSEIYPLWARSFCYSVSTSINWFFNLLVSLTFLTLTRVLTNHGAYYLYASIAFIGFMMFFVFLPETKGKTLEEIELLFEGPLLTLGKKRETHEGHTNHAHTNGSVDSVSTTSIRA